jgi:hypothetical protein
MQIVWWLLMHGNNTGKSQVRDQLQGEDFATIDASLIGTAGGRVFLNPKTGNDQTAVITIAETFRGVHLPSLGQFNGTLGSITGVITLTDSVSEPSSTVTLASQAIGAGVTSVITLANPIYVDKNAVLAVSASGASLAFTAFAYKVVQ